MRWRSTNCPAIDHVINCLKPLWERGHLVLRQISGWVSGDCPVMMAGNLGPRLGRLNAIHVEVRHPPALAYAVVPGLVRDLRAGTSPVRAAWNWSS